MDLIKLKSFCTSKETIFKRKDRETQSQTQLRDQHFHFNFRAGEGGVKMAEE